MNSIVIALVLLTGFVIYMILKKSDFDKNKREPDSGGKNDESPDGDSDGGGEG